MVNKNIICVIDGEAGSCGKAKVCGQIALDERLNIIASVTNSMPNAGHTFVSELGETYLFRNIPVAVVNPNVKLFIGPSSVIDMDVFRKEYEECESLLGNRQIYVHELVPLVEDRHKEKEKETIKSGSTYHGCAACNQEKIIRDPNLKFFKGYKKAIVLTNEEWLNELYNCLDDSNGMVLFEGSQGAGLSLNLSGNFPYVTSRNINVSNMLQEAGVSPRRLHTTVMVVRPFPIRINDITNEGKFVFTGSYGSGASLTWSNINIGAKLGFYPTAFDFDLFDNMLNDDLKNKLLNASEKRSLMQIFCERYKDITLSDINLIDALEMERLIYKGKGIREYVSKVIDLSHLDDPTLRDLSEMTSVTKLERKIFDLDINKLKSSVRINDPDCLYLNFFQHLDLEYEKCCGDYKEFLINRYIREYLNWLESSLGVDISTLGTGSKNNEYIKRRELIILD